MVLCPVMERQGLVGAGSSGQHEIVTISYPNGTVIQAIVLSHDEHGIRANATGCDDVLTFTRIHDTWISEEIDPVTMTFEWQRSRRVPAPSEDNCVCPKGLAARLVQSLFNGHDGEAAADTFCVFDPEESGHQTELRPN
jgi:hypothetical protein